MNKVLFEKLMEDKAQHIYNEHKMVLLKRIDDYFECFKVMNDHSIGNSLKNIINTVVNDEIEKRKKSIIDRYQKNQINELMEKLNSFDFLFKEQSNEQ